MSKASKSGKTTSGDADQKANPEASGSHGHPANKGTVGDVFDLPIVDEETVVAGAAADAADLDDKLKTLPRILRTAMLIDQGKQNIHDRLVADIEMLCPGLALTAAFATSSDNAVALALAKELDRCAVVEDLPELRHVADCVRMLSLPMQKDLANSEDYRRVTTTLMNALARLSGGIDPQLAAEIEEFCIGWAMIPVLKHRLPRYQQTAFVPASHARFLGSLTATRRVEAAEEAVWASIEAEKNEGSDEMASQQAQLALPVTAGRHERVVARLSDVEMKNIRLRELLPQYRQVINTAVPLVVPPPLEEVRKPLLFEFPYAGNVVDTMLADLIGRPTVLIRPTLIVGNPGAGKSLFVRRLSERLGVYCWRTDASRCDFTVFSGTDRRWNSAEPCHPFLAIARARHANPMILLDELEKASANTRTDGGRLWDCLLGFLELETAARYPDPVLQNMDLSNVSYVATSNSLAGLPRPLLDRFRIIDFPLPSGEHLDALLPGVIAELARDRGLDANWFAPLDAVEHAAIASAWTGGSVRSLRRLVEVILRERDANATRN